MVGDAARLGRIAHVTYAATAVAQVLTSAAIFVVASILGLFASDFFSPGPPFVLLDTTTVRGTATYAGVLVFLAVDRAVAVWAKEAATDAMRTGAREHFVQRCGGAHVAALTAARVAFALEDGIRTVVVLFYIRTDIVFTLVLAGADVAASAALHAYVLAARRAGMQHASGAHRLLGGALPLSAALAGVHLALLGVFGVFAHDYGRMGAPIVLFGGTVRRDAQVWMLVALAALDQLTYSATTRVLDAWRGTVMQATEAAHVAWVMETREAVLVQSAYTLISWVRRIFWINLAFTNVLFLIVQIAADAAVQGYFAHRTLARPHKAVASTTGEVVGALGASAAETLLVFSAIIIAAPWSLGYFRPPPPLPVFDVVLTAEGAIVLIAVLAFFEQGISSMYIYTTEPKMAAWYAGEAHFATADLARDFRRASWGFLVPGRLHFWLRRVLVVQVATANIVFMPILALADFLVVFGLSFVAIRDHVGARSVPAHPSSTIH